MIVLHRFAISNFSEKARATLAFKGLDYEIREHFFGLPQLRLVRLSGQRKVPVIEHQRRVVSDSTKIALYLETAFPHAPRLLPDDPGRREEVLALEDELDRELGIAGPVLWGDDVMRGRREDEMALLALEVHGLGPRTARSVGSALGALRRRHVLDVVIEPMRERTIALLARLSAQLEKTPYLCGESPTLADVAAAGLTMHLEWPKSARLAPQIPAGRGVRSLVERPELARFFSWRRELYAQHLAR